MAQKKAKKVAKKQATKKQTEPSASNEPTKDDLMEEAQELDIEGRSSMDKDELAKAVEDARAEKEKEGSGPSSDAAKASAKKAGPGAEKKRADAEKRLAESETHSLDDNDPARGWDAQQGRLPRGTSQGLYDDDPPRYSKDQLPDPKKLKEAGYKPVMREPQVSDD